MFMVKRLLLRSDGAKKIFIAVIFHIASAAPSQRHNAASHGWHSVLAIANVKKGGKLYCHGHSIGAGDLL